MPGGPRTGSALLRHARPEGPCRVMLSRPPAPGRPRSYGVTDQQPLRDREHGAGGSNLAGGYPGDEDVHVLGNRALEGLKGSVTGATKGVILPPFCRGLLVGEASARGRRLRSEADARQGRIYLISLWKLSGAAMLLASRSCHGDAGPSGPSGGSPDTAASSATIRPVSMSPR